MELAQLTARRTRQETNLRHSVVQAVLEYERAHQQLHTAQVSRASHSLPLRFAEICSRLREGSTETMLQLWQTETELERAVENAQLAHQQRLIQLQFLVLPLSAANPIPIIHSQT